MADVFCSSCKSRITNQVVTHFGCPGCGKTEVVRCVKCRENAARYTCAACGFSGPN